MCTGPEWPVRHTVGAVNLSVTRATECCNVAEKIPEPAVTIHGVYKLPLIKEMYNSQTAKKL